MDKNNDNKVDFEEWCDSMVPKFELIGDNITKVFRSDDDPVTIFKNNTAANKAFYVNNKGHKDPTEVFKLYLPVNMRSTLSIKKHIDN